MCGDGLASSRAWWGGGAILSLCGNLSLSQAPWARDLRRNPGETMKEVALILLMVILSQAEDRRGNSEGN